MICEEYRGFNLVASAASREKGGWTGEAGFDVDQDQYLSFVKVPGASFQSEREAMTDALDRLKKVIDAMLSRSIEAKGNREGRGKPA